MGEGRKTLPRSLERPLIYDVKKFYYFIRLQDRHAVCPPILAISLIPPAFAWPVDFLSVWNPMARAVRNREITAGAVPIVIAAVLFSSLFSPLFHLDVLSQASSE